MGIPRGFDLGTDSIFRLVAGYADAPRPGRIEEIMPNGQVRLEIDDVDGGEVLAWPLNGFEYGVGDVVYVLLSSNAPDAGVVLGSLAPLPGLAVSGLAVGGTLDVESDDINAPAGVFRGAAGQVAPVVATQRNDGSMGVHVTADAKGIATSELIGRGFWADGGISRAAGETIVRVVGVITNSRFALVRVTFTEVIASATPSSHRAAIARARLVSRSTGLVADIQSHELQQNRKIAVAVDGNDINFRITDTSDGNVSVSTLNSISVEVEGWRINNAQHGFGPPIFYP